MQETKLHAAHVALGAKMGEFAGYDMPLYYAEGVLKEHEWTRTHAGLFDVSHMGQISVAGPGACVFWERVTPSAFHSLPDGRAKYTVLPNEDGGIIDDLIVTRLGPEKFFAVVNAGCKDKDLAWLQANVPDNAALQLITDRALIALQGPEAELALREALQIDTAVMPYMWFEDRNGIWVSRLGYTGEDGFELSVPETQAELVWQKLLAHPSVKPVGLAARDSLRLEMGYPLYGHDITAETSPVEAALSWIVARDHADYFGAATIRAQMESGTAQIRAGIRLTGRGIAREGTELFDASGTRIGVMTSGGFSPTLKQSIGQGYITSAHAVEGEKIFANVRGNKIEAEIAPLSFVPARTKSMKKKAV